MVGQSDGRAGQEEKSYVLGMRGAWGLGCYWKQCQPRQDLTLAWTFFFSHNSNILENWSVFALFSIYCFMISGVDFPILSILGPAIISANVYGSGGRANQFETHPILCIYIYNSVLSAQLYG